jgi:O-antigen ligase
MLVFGWAVMLAAPKLSWRTLAVALTAGLLIQSVVGLIEVAVQNTGWLASLSLPWPGVLTAQTRGASVVGLANGLRWLRAYGTLPHPNMLGVYLVACLAGPLVGYLQTGKARWLGPLLIGTVALFLTFSRAAWLGCAALWVCAWVLSPVAVRKRVVTAGVSAGIALIIFVIALNPLVISRASASGESDREVSSTIERLGLMQVALDFIRSRPLNGVGGGVFTVAMAATAPVAEPVHNLPLLAASETGLGGGAAVVGLMGLMGLRVWRRRGKGGRESILAAALIASLVIAQFDHVFWSLSEGRLWAALLIGLWLGRSDQ